MAISSKQQYCYDYPRPAVTVDIVIVTREPRPRVLLVRRKHDPFAGMWAVPGGFVEMDESLEDAAHRELKEETGIKAGRLRQLHTFGAPGRDPRGRTISVVYMAQLDAQASSLKPMTMLRKLAGSAYRSRRLWRSIMPKSWRPPEAFYDRSSNGGAPAARVPEQAQRFFQG